MPAGDLKQDYLRRLLRTTPVSFEESLGPGTTESTAPGVVAAASGAVEALKPTAAFRGSLTVMEAIVVPYLRPVYNVVNDSFADPPSPWNALAGPKQRAISRTAIRAIGRIEIVGLPGIPYGGTGFIIGPNLVLTNRHVAELFTSGLGLSNLVFRPGRSAGIDLKQEAGSNESIPLKVTRVRMVHPWWDAAFLEVEGIPPGRPVLTLAASEPDKLDQRLVATIGYPALIHARTPACRFRCSTGSSKKSACFRGP